MEERKVLLVEDEKKIADTLPRGLKELDYHVDTAYDGKIGLRLYESGTFNLVITDINLPALMGTICTKSYAVATSIFPLLCLRI